MSFRMNGAKIFPNNGTGIFYVIYVIKSISAVSHIFCCGNDLSQIDRASKADSVRNFYAFQS